MAETRALKGALRDEGEQQRSARPVFREPLYQRLKPGPGMSATAVAANQRARLCGAMVELVAERGYDGVTVRELSRLAGVSTKTFYDCFANVGECFATTQARIIRDALRPARTAVERDGPRLRARMRDLFLGLGTDPKAAHLVLVESLAAAGAQTDPGVESLSRTLERVIRDEFATRSNRVLLRPALSYGIVCGALRIVRVYAGRDRCELLTAADRFCDWLQAVRDPRLVRGYGQSEPETAGRVRSAPRVPKRSDRELLLSAATKLCAVGGYEKLTVPEIRREAGVSRRSFDANFEGVEDCFLAAVEGRFTGALRRAVEDANGVGSWEGGVVRVVACLANDFGRDSAMARVLFIQIRSPGRAGIECRERIIARWARLLRASAPGDLAADEVSAEASAATAWGIAEASATTHRGAQIGADLQSMAFLLLAPVVGPDAASTEISAQLASH